MVVSKMIEQVQNITQIKRSDAELVDDFNRGLLDLSSALFLTDTFVQAWEAGVESYPGPDSVLEFSRYGRFQPAGGSGVTTLPRIQQGSSRQGWWYDGANIGIQLVGPMDGEFELPFLRYPNLLSVTDTFAEPDGGDSVSQALITYACYVSYATLGDEVSIGMANNYRQFYEQAKQRIHHQRSRLVNTAPTAWRMK